ncbi:MAG: substrate-binding domain-containing protein [Maritimibacter sp.]
MLAGAVAALSVAATGAMADTSACLITKTDTNPFFVKMREGAEAKAKELGINLYSYAGKVDGDNETQVAAIETCIANGVSGILLTASSTSAIVPSVEQARAAGILVIALDTPLEPVDSADMTFATDNFLAGELIGKWAKAQMGDAAADAKIAMLDLDVSQPSVGVLRDQGFLQGFGVTDPGVNVVYTINEPAAAGAYEALKSIGRQDDVLIVSVDGGCPGVANVKDGVIGATSQQYPLLMASKGIEAIAAFAADGTKPAATEGKNFFDTGVSLVTDKPAEGVDSISVEEGANLCWG